MNFPPHEQILRDFVCGDPQKLLRGLRVAAELVPPGPLFCSANCHADQLRPTNLPQMVAKLKSVWCGVTKKTDNECLKVSRVLIMNGEASGCSMVAAGVCEQRDRLVQQK